jgi:hypothetical protein
MAVSLTRALELRRRFEEVTRRYLGDTLDNTVLAGLLAGLKAVGLTSVRRSTIERSMPDLLGRKLGETEAVQLTYRLAGNIERLRKDTPVPPWQFQVVDEVVSVQVLQLVRAASKRRKAGFSAKLLVLTGYPAGKMVENFWSYELCRYVSTRVFGFSSRRGARPYERPEDLVRLYTGLEIDAKKSDDAPRYGRFVKRNELVEINQKRISARLDKNSDQAPYPCPIEFPGSCAICPVGYRPSPEKRHCPLATHPETYEVGPCSFCGREEATFDPGVSTRSCALCDQKQRLNPT